MLKEQVQKLVGDLKVERPANPERGDYAIFGNLSLESALIERIEQVKGFTNIFLKPEVWYGELKKILDLQENYSVLTLGQEQTVNIEFISANPTGELHVGNGRGAFFGDVLANVLEKAGYNVEREYYVNNAKVSLQIKELGKTALGSGESYKTDYLSHILENVRIKLQGANNESQAGHLVAQEILKDIQQFVTGQLGVRIDKWFLEDDLFESGAVNVVKSEVKTYEKDGAIWAKTTDFGDDEDRVLVRSDGTPGYFLSDIAYHKNKAARADILVDIWGADHQGHVKRMFAAARALGFAEKLQILITQLVHLKEEGETKKMSKRAGDFVTLKWLIDEVGVDAARFFFLSKSLSTHMDFDVALAKEQSQKNPVYYVQYSYARSHQIFKKSGVSLFDPKTASLELLKESAEMALIKKLVEWPEIIEGIVLRSKDKGDYELQKITTYATQAAAAFHRFYESCHVLVEDDELRAARMALVRAYQIVLGDVLVVLGVSRPESM